MDEYTRRLNHETHSKRIIRLCITRVVAGFCIGAVIYGTGLVILKILKFIDSFL